MNRLRPLDWNLGEDFKVAHSLLERTSEPSFEVWLIAGNEAATRQPCLEQPIEAPSFKVYSAAKFNFGHLNGWKSKRPISPLGFTSGTTSPTS